MKKIFESPDQRIQLWHGKCVDFKFPSDAIAITDPPYNIGKPQLIGNFKSQKVMGRDFGEDFDVGAILPSQWASHMPDTVLSFYSAKRMSKLIRAFEKAGYEIVQDFHYCKTNVPPPLRGIGFAWATESGYVFRKVGTKHVVNKKAGYSPNFFVSPRATNLTHSTPKPLAVMKWLVKFFTLEESLVVDPFMGGGETAIACIELGRRFLGIEQKQEYCDLAVQRVKDALVRRRGSFQFKS